MCRTYDHKSPPTSLALAHDPPSACARTPNCGLPVVGLRVGRHHARVARPQRPTKRNGFPLLLHNRIHRTCGTRVRPVRHEHAGGPGAQTRAGVGRHILSATLWSAGVIVLCSVCSATLCMRTHHLAADQHFHLWLVLLRDIENVRAPAI